ncbi:NifB/NifX family molybdenum-iron cluster-binding protein [Neptunomonas antarctica]|uniref:Predicted Fe-Mo cluster-binding protein, NifX family n=1 Tax=Neptunomonas antarctica TaxID=619304 RepID=A0A1N7LGR6_9GAMM|nr:NifB/NifX family molybdenum-iron cluster-binding protein [Neptunomonas antarctica]SIS72993.1 Predicted Fe-Mo cluster-binding protein, NifX family [Neptunomonas antarctica]
MKIAVTSQNRKNITEHAGRCRNFWVFTTNNNIIVNSELLELRKEQSFHDSSQDESHPLDDVNILIAGGMGQGLMGRLERKGILSLITKEKDPEEAVLLYLKGKLECEQPNLHQHGHNK